MKIITITGCCVSGMIKSAMITECWTPQSSHRDTFFSIYLVLYLIAEITPGKAVILLSDCGFNFKTNWNQLTGFLNVPVEQKEKMRAILKEDEAYEYPMEIALDWWIKNTSEASWKELISSVDKCGEKDTAHAMKKKLSEEGKNK